MKNFSKMRQGLSCVVMAFLLMLIPAGVFAQNSISVSGIVMDDTNEPVIGAAVMVKGTTIGVITDIDGRYTISTPADGILSFSYVGLKDKEEKVNGRTTINIIMQTDSKMIDEVVVIGYGTQRRGSVTGAVSALKGIEHDEIRSVIIQHFYLFFIVIKISRDNLFRIFCCNTQISFVRFETDSIQILIPVFFK